MSLMETLLSGAVVSVVLAVLVLVSHTLRAEAGEAQTRRTLTMLRAAMVTYHSANAPDRLPEDDQAAIRLLLMDPRSGADLAALPLEHHAEHVSILDGFGQPLFYIPPSETQDRVGDFVSAGLDGQFGDPFISDPLTADPEASRAAVDDIYSSFMDIE